MTSRAELFKRVGAALILLSAAFSGCGRSTPVPVVRTTQPATAHGHANEPNTSQPKARKEDITWTLGGPDGLLPDNPAAEGWQSEAFTQAANKQLKQLGEFVVAKSAPPPPHVATLLDGAFSSGPLLPTNSRVVLDDPNFYVERMLLPAESVNRQAATVSRPFDRLRAVVEPLQRAMADYSDLRFKFKLFRVAMSEDHVTTQQYFNLNGRSQRGAREQNAIWEIVWTRPSPSQAPRIQSIRVVEFEQVSTMVPDGLLLNDCTDSVLARNESYQVAGRPSIPYWRDRLESQLGVYHFGHHGLAIGDVNGDDRDDLYVCQTGGIPNHLYLQRSDGTLSDVSSDASVDYLDNTRSALFVDLDNDGDQDLILALTTGLMFLENKSSSDGIRFNLRARIPSVRQAFSLSAADYDQDSDLDLYVCVYYGEQDQVAELPHPLPYFDATNGGGNFLIRNQGGWRFENITEQVGLGHDNGRFSLASAWEDYDNDGDVDLLVVNDFGPNQLYRNNDGRFEDVAAKAKLLDRAFGMSATFADFDHNQWMDVYVSNMFSAAGNRVTFQPQFKQQLSVMEKERFQYLARGNSLFRNVGRGHFEDVSVSHGVTIGRWSWGSLFADLNNDSWDDLLVANGFLTGESVDDL